LQAVAALRRELAAAHAELARARAGAQAAAKDTAGLNHAAGTMHVPRPAKGWRDGVPGLALARYQTLLAPIFGWMR